MKSSIRTLASSTLMIGSIVWVASGCVPTPTDPNVATIAQDGNYSAAVPLFTGTGNSIPLTPTVTVPKHPGLAARGHNSMHGDSGMSGTHSEAGPDGATGFKIGSASMLNANGIKGGECGNTTFNSDGLLISFCADFNNFKIYALQPSVDDQGNERFRKVAEYAVAERESTTKAKQDIFNYDIELVMGDTSGGAYSHLDNNDRLVLADARNQLKVLELNTFVNGEGLLQGSFTAVVDAPLGLHVDFDIDYADPNHHDVTNVMPDWNNNTNGVYWFITRQGMVGTIEDVNGTQNVQYYDLNGEEIQNAMAMDSSGVYVVSDTAMYKFVLDGNNAPVIAPAWASGKTYDRGTAAKPGQLNQGSGTTPALMGDNNQYIGITDNADPVNIVVYDRADGTLVCEEAVFNDAVHALAQPDPSGMLWASGSDNSLIGYENSLIVENNWGYQNATVNNWTVPGLTRVDVVANPSYGETPAELAANCTTEWKNITEASQSTVPKLSLGSGLVYIYTREDIPGNGADPDGQNAQAYYFGALDYTNGEMVYKKLTGTGENWNNNYAPISIGPDGTAYVGAFNGIISVKDI